MFHFIWFYHSETILKFRRLNIIKNYTIKNVYYSADMFPRLQDVRKVLREKYFQEFEKRGYRVKAIFK